MFVSPVKCKPCWRFLQTVFGIDFVDKMQKGTQVDLTYAKAKNLPMGADLILIDFFCKGLAERLKRSSATPPEILSLSSILIAIAIALQTFTRVGEGWVLIHCCLSVNSSLILAAPAFAKLLAIWLKRQSVTAMNFSHESKLHPHRYSFA